MIRYLAILFIFLGFYSSRNLYGSIYPDEVIKLFNCIDQEKDSPEKVDCYIKLSTYFRQVNKDSSLLFCNEAYRISVSIGYAEGKCDALYKRTQVYDNMGKLPEAIMSGNQCLHLADSLNDSVRMGKAYFKLAGLYNESANLQVARSYYLKALEIFQHRNDTASLVAVYNGLGNYYDNITFFDTAAYYFHQSIRLCEMIGWNQALGRILGNLGLVYMELHDLENARKYLLLSLDYNLENNDINNIPLVYSRLGVVAIKEGHYKNALEYFDRADSILAFSKDSMCIAEVSVNRAKVYRKQRNFNQAMDLLKSTLSYYKRQGHTDGMIAIWENMAEINGYMGMTNKALLYFDSCVIQARKDNNLGRLQDIYSNIYSLYNELGFHKEALDVYIRYQEVSDSIFDLGKAELIHELRLKYEKEKDQLQILELEHQNLRRKKQRNLLLFVGLGIILSGIFLIAFLRFKHKKNRVISEQKIQQLEEEKRHLAARFLVEGEERERKRLALELHDNLGVLLSATKMQFGEIRDKSPENADLIRKASKFLEQASTDVRKISHNLMPGLLTKLGLYEALEGLFENLNEHDGFDAFIEIIGAGERLDENREIMIYRIVQEMLNNTIKHADATKIDLTMVVDAEEINISYADNGKGFKVEEVLKNKTLGLQNIQSRVKYLNGRISIESDESNGVVFLICIPLEEDNCAPCAE